jgi:DNA-binding transcriptional regulator YdaS (Cro superfamily)
MSASMNLKAYLRKTRTTQKALAETLGVTQGAVSQWLVGTQEITPQRAVEIEKATNKSVTRYDLRPDIFGKAPDELRA